MIASLPKSVYESFVGSSHFTRIIPPRSIQTRYLVYVSEIKYIARHMMGDNPAKGDEFMLCQFSYKLENFSETFITNYYYSRSMNPNKPKWTCTDVSETEVRACYENLMGAWQKDNA